MGSLGRWFHRWWHLLPPSLLLAPGLVLGPGTLTAQRPPPPDTVERWLTSLPVSELGRCVTSRGMERERTYKCILTLENERSILVKWARAPRGGEEFNNVPRYEVAAYRLQKLFLDQSEYCVPPTVVRSFPVEWYRRQGLEPGVVGTFGGAESVLVVLQSWLFGVEPIEEVDAERFERDVRYARHQANMNVLTHLIDNKDANYGNFLISTDESDPRVYSVDNGVAFGSLEGDRGDYWRRLRVDRIPRKTADRLRRITREELDRALGVVAEFEVRQGRLVRVVPGENLRPEQGIREEDGVIQLGLTSREIARLEDRLRRLVEDLQEGDLGVF